MNQLPEKILSVDELTEFLSRPTEALVEMMQRIDGDFMFLGVGGKMGPSMALMALRAARKAGTNKKVIGVSRFSNREEQTFLEKSGVETIKGDLLNKDFLESLPQAKNIVFLAGMKFGSEDNLSLTWAMNTYLPALVANYFTNSKIVALSTGTVYSLVPVASGGAKETDTFEPVGEYAQSCLGRERMFEYGSGRYGNPSMLIRLNYAVEMRYGVLVDVARKVLNERPVDLTMGCFNAIWQGEANDMILRSLEYASSPAAVLNVTGSDTIYIRQIAEKFGKLFGKKPIFTGKEADSALLNNASKAFGLFGRPNVSIDKIINWTADWMLSGKEMLNKPTHFEVRDGKF